jgi:hypothetical protein
MSINVGYNVNFNNKFAIFHLEGGLGKNIAASAMARIIKKNHPDRKLVIVASYPEIFLNNPYVYRVYPHGSVPYFYDDYILDKDSILFKHEPYFHTTHILKQQSLIKTWADLYQLKYTEDDLLPELYYNMVQNKMVNIWERNRPVLVLHTNGGPLTEQKYNYSWTRDLPYELSEKIVEKYKNKYHIIQVCRNESQVLPGVEAITSSMGNLELFSLLAVSKKRILIDSCLQHAAAAFNLPSTVFWIGTSPTVFGYHIHDNITANSPQGNVKLLNSYLFDYQFTGELHECPYMGVEEMFDIPTILEKL